MRFDSPRLMPGPLFDATTTGEIAATPSISLPPPRQCWNWPSWPADRSASPASDHTSSLRSSLRISLIRALSLVEPPCTPCKNRDPRISSQHLVRLRRYGCRCQISSGERTFLRPPQVGEAWDPGRPHRCLVYRTL